MNLRSLFTHFNFWGKILGGFFGYIMAGPAGALFGILIGNLFDRGLAQHYNRPYWEVYLQGKSSTQHQFLNTTFLLLGYLAKSDGRVTERAIFFAHHLMEDLRLNSKQFEQAKADFQTGKKKEFDLLQTLLAFKATAQMHPELMTTLLNILYRAANDEGLTLSKLKNLNQIFQILGFAPIEQQFRYYHDDSFHYNKHHFNQQKSDSAPLAEAYAILGVDKQANQATVKQAYRRLIGKHHPDKLVSQGKSEAEIKRANEKTQQIRKAYEFICQQKNWG